MVERKHLEINGDTIYCARDVYERFLPAGLSPKAWIAGQAKLRRHLEAELQAEMPKRWQAQYDKLIAAGNDRMADAVKRKMECGWKAKAPRVICPISERQLSEADQPAGLDREEKHG